MPTGKTSMVTIDTKRSVSV